MKIKTEIQDAELQQLQALIKLTKVLTSYLTLFRLANPGLDNERARSLASETLALVPKLDALNTAQLALALSETVEALQGKQPRQPMKNHTGCYGPKEQNRACLPLEHLKRQTAYRG